MLLFQIITASQEFFLRIGCAPEVDRLEFVRFVVLAFRIQGPGEVDLFLAVQHKDTALV